MLFSGVGILIVAIALLTLVPVAGLLLLGWSAVHLVIVAITVTRMSRSAHEAARGVGGRSASGLLGGHLLATFVLLAIGAPVAVFGLLIWAASQGRLG